MPPILRKTVSTLLCGLILMGQSAAWVHVATCDGNHAHPDSALCDSRPVQNSAQSVDDHSHHCCGHHHTHGHSGESPEGGDSGKNSAPQPSHDSDHCAVCQSLASATGVVVAERMAPTADVLPERMVVVDSVVAQSLALSLPRLRGPPIG